MLYHYPLTGNGCSYPPDKVTLSGSPTTSVSIANTMPAEGYGHSFMEPNETMEIQCRNGMRMSPDLADSRRTVTCSTNNTWVVDRSFECVPSESQPCVNIFSNIICEIIIHSNTTALKCPELPPEPQGGVTTLNHPGDVNTGICLGQGC